MAIRAAALISVAATLLFAGPGGVPDQAKAQQRQPPRVSAPATVAPATKAPATIDPYPTATDARLGGDDNQTRFVMDLSRKVELRAFTLADPYRVVIDLSQVTFKLPPKAGDSGRGLVKAFRYGLVMQGGSRIVLDTGKPVRIDKAFVLEQTDSQPARLVLDLAQTDRETFMRTIALDNPRTARTDPKRFEREAPIKGDPRPLIVLDPGHGGIDHGTRAASGETEKQIVLDFTLLLRDQLERSGKYRVVMTRADDTFVALDERVRMARARQASLFISIHADALKKTEGEAQGATIYTVADTASDAEAAKLAENENRADVIAGIDLSREPDDVAEILVDLAQRETKTFSLHFAKTLVTELRNVARLHKHPMKSAGFRVLKAPDVPSVLVELGYVSNKEDLKQLVSGAWRNRTAASIVQAVDTFFSTRMAGSAGQPQ